MNPRRRSHVQPVCVTCWTCISRRRRVRFPARKRRFLARVVLLGQARELLARQVCAVYHVPVTRDLAVALCDRIVGGVPSG